VPGPNWNIVAPRMPENTRLLARLIVEFPTGNVAAPKQMLSSLVTTEWRKVVISSPADPTKILPGFGMRFVESCACAKGVVPSNDTNHVQGTPLFPSANLPLIEYDLAATPAIMLLARTRVTTITAKAPVPSLKVALSKIVLAI